MLQLHVQSVQKILKGIYWLLKKLPNVRQARVTDPEENLVVRDFIRPYTQW